MSHVRKRPGRSGWQARWLDSEGNERSRTFDRKIDAQRFLADIDAQLARGTYVDPSAGRVLFRDYAEQWLTAQTFDRNTREGVEVRLRLHIYPRLGALELRQIKPSTVQAWLRSLSALAPTYQRTIYANVSTILSAAVDDELITRNPCQTRSVRSPRAHTRKIIPWTVDQVLDVTAALPERFRIIATLGAGLGLRQGETFALSTHDVDWLRGEVHVRRQVKLFGDGSQVFALPKGGKERSVPIPLPATVRDELAAFLARHPPRTVTLPWDTVDGKPTSVELIVSTRETTALNRNYFNSYVWKPALAAAGITPSRENGTHALRHFFASALLDGGESIKAVSEYLGHADAGFTLRTYSHMMPSSADRTRKIIDSALAPTVHRRSKISNGHSEAQEMGSP